MPTRPMVAMKAKARGTPAKLEATPGEGQQARAHGPGQAAHGHRVGQQETEQASGNGGDRADLDGDDVAIQDVRPGQVGEVGHGEMPFRVLEGPRKIALAGRIMKARAKIAKGTRPSQGYLRRRGGARAGAPCSWVVDSHGACSLLLGDVDVDDLVPVLGAGLLDGLPALMVGKKVLMPGGGGGSLASEVGRDHLALGQVVEPDRVAVALEPDELAFVGVEVLLPQPGRVGVGA